MNINKAIVYGNLTRDPELRTLPNGTNVCSFAVATNRIYTDRDGQRQESTEFHNIVVFGRQAETCAQYLKKGNGAFVEGRLQTRNWESEGVKQYRTEIVADRVQFGPRGGERAEAGAASSGAAGSTAAPSQATAADNSSNKLPDYPEEEINPEDIPF